MSLTPSTTIEMLEQLPPPIPYRIEPGLLSTRAGIATGNPLVHIQDHNNGDLRGTPLLPLIVLKAPAAAFLFTLGKVDNVSLGSFD
jgi:hypothetical protein